MSRWLTLFLQQNFDSEVQVRIFFNTHVGGSGQKVPKGRIKITVGRGSAGIKAGDKPDKPPGEKVKNAEKRQHNDMLPQEAEKLTVKKINADFRSPFIPRKLFVHRLDIIYRL